MAFLLVASAAAAQDFGLDLSNDVDTGKPKLQVTLTQNLKGATLYVDEVEIGPLPMEAIPVSKGDHAIAVVRPGYADFTTTIKAQKGTVNVSATLEATGEALNLTSEPDAADIVVDNKGKGKTPKTLSLAPGRHDLRLLKDGFQDWTYTLFTRAGRDEDLNAELKPVGAPAVAQDTDQTDPDLALKRRGGATASSPFYTRWYVWGGAAVVVAAVVTGVVVASAHHPGLSQSQVCGGPCDVVLNAR
jgi:hypothetical protein